MPRTLLLRLVALLFFASSAIAQTVVKVAVEDRDYAPYYTWENGALNGPCGDIVSAVFDAMGVEVEFVGAPWVRVIKMVEDKTADAALCATETEERRAYAVFPAEHLLSYDATLFVLDGSPLATTDPTTLTDGSFALVGGYSFAGVDQELEERGLVRLETTSRESLVRVLLAGRVDMVLDSRLPIFADAEAFGVADQIRALEPTLSETPAYLMFSAKEGANDVARAFSDALAQFKTTPEFAEIAMRYRMLD